MLSFKKSLCVIVTEYVYVIDAMSKPDQIIANNKNFKQRVKTEKLSRRCVIFFSMASRQQDLLRLADRLCCRDTAHCHLQGLNTPLASDRWTVEGVLVIIMRLPTSPLIQIGPRGAQRTMLWARLQICYTSLVRNFAIGETLYETCTLRVSIYAFRLIQSLTLG